MVPSRRGAPLLAKLTAPEGCSTLARPRLFARLDAATERPLVWIDAPGGYGKTALAASWIAARGRPCLWYRLDAGDDDLATFLHYFARAANALDLDRPPVDWRLAPSRSGAARIHLRRCFEQLGERLPPDAVVVLDNYERLLAQSPMHDLLAGAVEALPPGVPALVLGRHSAPPSFARHRANGRTARLGWRDLRLTAGETRALALGYRPSDAPPLPPAIVDALHARTEGWVAGLVLLLEQLRSHEDAPAEPAPISEWLVFDYFATELLPGVSPELRAFLLRTAALPEMTVALAAAVTGDGQAERCLAELVRANLFTTERAAAEPVYVYHPMFAAFLQQQALATIDGDTRRRIAERAGEFFAERGDVVAAMELLGQAGAWDRVAALVREHATALIEAGRHQTLATSLGRIPREQLEADPSLRFWLGTALAVHDPAAARAEFEAAFAGSRALGDDVGAALAWAGICESILIERRDMAPLDRWLDALEPELAAHGVPGPPEVGARVLPVLFAALVHRRPDHPRLGAWERQVLELMQRTREPNAKVVIGWHLANAAHWSGDLPRARLITDLMTACLREPGVDPFAQSLVLTSQAILDWLCHDPAASLAASGAGLALAERTGIHVWDAVLAAQAVYAHLARGDAAAARASLEPLAAVRLDGVHVEVSHYHLLASCVALAEGNASEARTHGESAVAAARCAGAPFPLALAGLTLARARVAAGDLTGVATLVSDALALGQRMGSRLLLLEAGLVDAAAALTAGDDERAAGALRAALRVGAAADLLLQPWWTPAMKVRLCATALAHGVEPEHVRRIVRTEGLVPDARAAELEAWPWPVRVRVLGRFEVEVDGAPAAWGSKGPGRARQLLTCLIAHGGHDIPAQHVADCLWPEADGDSAAASLKTTLARLRRIIGHECVHLSHSKLSLNTDWCWIDALQLERASAAGEAAADRVAQLYRGDFVADRDSACVLAARRRLKHGAVRALRTLADARRREGRLREAIALYQRCVAIDPAGEGAYRELMRCYAAEGRQAEAVTVFRECEAALSTHLGTPPSELTTQLAKVLRKGR